MAFNLGCKKYNWKKTLFMFILLFIKKPNTNWGEIIVFIFDTIVVNGSEKKFYGSIAEETIYKVLVNKYI